MNVRSIITIRPMPRTVRTTIMIRNLVIRPLGTHHNGKIALMKDSYLLERSITSLSTYFIDCCIENTFANCIYANKRTHFYHVVFTEI
jgi:hypothetical protein